MCRFVTQHNATKQSQVLRERAIGMLTAGMSTRAVARELNVNFSTINCIQRRFREFGSTSNRPHNRNRISVCNKALMYSDWLRLAAK